MSRINPGNLMVVVLLCFSLVMAISLTVTYKPEIFSWFALGFESGLISEYEVHYEDGNVEGSSIARPMSAVTIRGNEKPIEKLLVRPMYKLNIPNEHQIKKCVISYDLSLFVDGVEVWKQAFSRSIKCSKEIPLGLISITSKDLEKIFKEIQTKEIHTLEFRVCNLKIESKDFSKFYPGCKTLLTYFIQLRDRYIIMRSGNDTPVRFD